MRYAVYFAPPPGSAFGIAAASWLGRDAFSCHDRPQPAVPGVAPDALAALTADPRRYGFHATLRAPFRLKEPSLEPAFMAAVAGLAGRTPAFAAPLAVRRFDGFLAILPASAAAAGRLSALAADVVTQTDAFRAPLTAEDRARRGSSLSPRQADHLERYGYPYVLDEFEFHMTLSQRLADETAAAALEAAARDHFADGLAEAVAIDALTIFVERAPGMPFQAFARFPLASR